MMSLMSQPKFLYPVSVRTSPRAKLAFDRVAASLKASELVRWHGKRVTKEVVFAAVWMWLDELGDESLEKVMAAYLPRLEKRMDGAAEAELPPAPDISIRAGDKVIVGPAQREPHGPMVEVGQVPPKPDERNYVSRHRLIDEHEQRLERDRKTAERKAARKRGRPDKRSADDDDGGGNVLVDASKPKGKGSKSGAQK